MRVLLLLFLFAISLFAESWGYDYNTGEHFNKINIVSSFNKTDTKKLDLYNNTIIEGNNYTITNINPLARIISIHIHKKITLVIRNLKLVSKIEKYNVNHTNDIIYIDAGNTDSTIIIDNVVFENSPDSGIFISKNNGIIIIKNTKFINCKDAAIYISGDGSQNGKNLIIKNNYFYNNNVAVIIKRKFKYYIINSNIFEKNRISIAQGEADHKYLPGDKGIITNNIIFDNTEQGIILRVQKGTIVSNNIIKSKLIGINVEGSTDCIISNNTIFAKMPIRIIDKVIYGKIYKHKDNLIINNKLIKVK